ncbi:response regulator [Scytonema sp. UIC 10036]|uniref:hybrid sensor histidine kinase/response regulator n=1 Tax=Scytonema sp. UIC 10036 TaxID=2304196 RepID=UPI0012DA3291|nr:response regulator [Scytonema sp. UIC 10036]MUG99758.1 response regulator [Scytonema sp. UIC 10036]
MTKVLVIEDEEHIREIISVMLNAEDFEVMEAEDGRMGVDLAQKNKPDLVICDVMMPQLDGYGVLNELRQNPSTQTTPFIFLTAKAAKVSIRQGMELGADDYLTKPFTRDELLGAVTARLKKQAEIEKQSQQKLDVLRDNISMSLPHELHTPLNGIIGFAQFLIDNYGELERDEALKMLQIIHSSGNRLHRLTRNFLLFAELELATTSPERAQILRSEWTMSHTKTTITDFAQQEASKANRQTDLHLELQESSAKISQSSLHKILLEILDNAFKFSQPGTPVVVSTAVQDNTFVLSVSDNGRGMTSEQISNLGAYMQFERKLYEQQGSGLGLVIVKRLTSLYEGHLTIESIPSQKTIVRVTLPLEEAVCNEI